MVLINVKLSEEDQFFYSTTCDVLNEVLRNELADIQNLRKRLQLTIIEAEDLVKYGPMKDELVEDELVNHIKNLSINVGSGNTTSKEPNKLRVGEGLSEDLAKPISRAVGEAAALISKESVKAKTPLSVTNIQNAIDGIKKAILDSPTLLLKGDDILKHFLLDTSISSDMDKSITTIWWANKELLDEEPLSKFIGKNEKTTIVVKFSKKGQGAPPREPYLDTESHKAMMAYYHRKQEEHKRLMENNEDNFLNSTWADNKNLRTNFTGMSNIGYK